MKDARMSLRMPDRMRRNIESRLAKGESMNDWVLDSCSERLRHADDGNKSKFRELQVFPARDGEGNELGNPYDRRFDQLIQRYGLVTEFAGGGGEIDPALKRIMREVLTDLQYRRLEIQLTEGITLEQIAHREGCAKQAVHTSLHSAYRNLEQSEDFKKLLKERATVASIEAGGELGRKAAERGDISFDRLLEIVANGAAVVGDISTDGRHFHPAIAKAMKPLLTRAQYVRLEAHMVAGMPLRQIADEEDCSLTSVAVSIKKAKNKVRASVPVVQAVLKAYTDFTGQELDEASILAAVRARRLDQGGVE